MTIFSQTSKLNEPVTSYALSGTYDVIITAYANGISGSATLYNAVEVVSLDGGLPYPFSETFENDPLDSLWTIFNDNNDEFNWRLSKQVAYTGTNSLQIRNNENKKRQKYKFQPEKNLKKS